MAYTANRIFETARGSSNVSAITWSGNPPVYSSGGIAPFTCVTLDTGGTDLPLDVIQSTTGDLIYGVASDEAVAYGPGDDITVVVGGVAKVKAHAAITVGQLVYVAASDGTVGPVPAAGATNSYIVGLAETAATEAGDLLSVRLMIGGSTTVNA